MSSIANPEVLALAELLGVAVSDTERRTGLLRIVDALGKRGHVVVLKWDGQRNPEMGDNGAFTAIISGGDLAGEFFRRDDETLEGAIEYVLTGYARWAMKRSSTGIADAP